MIKKITFEQDFSKSSKFYIGMKGYQEKKMDISVVGKDTTGKVHQLADFGFDLAQYVGQS